MRKLLFPVSLTVVAVAIIGGALCTTGKMSHGIGYGDDLRLRMNEISCLRGGVNPYDVWSGKVEHPVFVRFQNVQAVEKGKKPLNCYTPWAYVYLLPLNMFPEPVGAPLYLGLMVLAIGVLGFVAFRYGTDVDGSREVGFFAAAVAILMPSMIFSDCTVLNFGILVTASLALMMVCLETRHDAMAGICLAFAMTKPQMTALFLIPLLLRRKFLTLAVGAFICLLTSLFSAWMCRTSPVNLIVQSVGGSIGAFVGCDLIPYPVFSALRRFSGCSLLPIGISMSLGLALCITLTVRARESGWLALFLPASIFTTAYTYTTLSNRCLTYFVLLTLSLLWLRKSVPGWKAALALLVLLRPVDGACRILEMASGILSAWQLSPAMARLVQLPFSLAAFAASLWVFYRHQQLAFSSNRAVS